MPDTGGFNMGSMPAAQTTTIVPPQTIRPQAPPASPAMFPAAVPPAGGVQNQHMQQRAVAPPAPPQVPFPQQFSRVSRPGDDFRNMVAMHLQAQGGLGGRQYALGPTIDPALRAKMLGLPLGPGGQ